MSVSKLVLSEVKSKISVPMYFYNIIVPNMPSYYNGDYPCDFDVKPVVKCPLHDEDTPSMRYYEETNSFYCFGCRAGGDVIQLHRLFTEKMNGEKPTYEEAVGFLFQYFIKGRETVPLKNRIQEEQSINSSESMIIYTKYVGNLEQALLVDNHISLDSKQKIWSLLDEINILISLNKVDALEAKQEIQKTVRETIA